MLSLTCCLLLMLGSACILTDALGKPVKYIKDLILELMRGDISNNMVANTAFLDHLQRILGCCGANGWGDYYQLGLTVPDSCYNR